MSDTTSAYLTEVIVQPRFVIIHEGQAHTIVGDPATVPATAWRQFADNAFGEDDLAQLVQRFTASSDAVGDGPESAQRETGDDRLKSTDPVARGD